MYNEARMYSEARWCDAAWTGLYMFVAEYCRDLYSHTVITETQLRIRIFGHANGKSARSFALFVVKKRLSSWASLCAFILARPVVAYLYTSPVVLRTAAAGWPGEQTDMQL